jgi:hypothetical protein
VLVFWSNTDAPGLHKGRLMQICSQRYTIQFSGAENVALRAEIQSSLVRCEIPIQPCLQDARINTRFKVQHVNGM